MYYVCTQEMGPQDKEMVLSQLSSVLHCPQRIHGRPLGWADGHPPLALLLLQALDGLGLHSQLWRGQSISIKRSLQCQTLENQQIEQLFFHSVGQLVAICDNILLSETTQVASGD